MHCVINIIIYVFVMSFTAFINTWQMSESVQNITIEGTGNVHPLFLLDCIH